MTLLRPYIFVKWTASDSHESIVSVQLGLHDEITYCRFDAILLLTVQFVLNVCQPQPIFFYFQFHDWVTNKKDRKWYRSNPEKALMVCSGFEPGAAVDEGWKAQTNPLIYDGQYNSVQFFQPIIILILCRKFTSQNWSMGWLVEWVSIIDCRPIFVKLFLTLTFCWAEDNGSRSGRVADLWHQYCKAFWSPETLGER